MSDITRDGKADIANIKKEPRVGPGWIEVTLAPERRCLLFLRAIGGVSEGVNGAVYLVFENRGPLRVEHTYDEVRSALFGAQALEALEDAAERTRTAERFAEALDELAEDEEDDGFEKPA